MSNVCGYCNKIIMLNDIGKHNLLHLIEILNKQNKPAIVIQSVTPDKSFNTDINDIK